MIAPAHGRVRVLSVALGLAALALLLAACTGGTSGNPATPTTSVGLSPCDPSPNASQAPTTIPEQGDLLLAAGDPDAAKTLYEKVLADPRALPADKLCAARGLAAIAAEPAPPTTAQQRVASGWDAAYTKELKPLQDVIVPMLVVLAVLLGLSRFATAVFVGPSTPGPASDGRPTRTGLALAYWFGVAAQTGAAILGVLTVARGATWTTATKVSLSLCAGVVIAAGAAAAICLFALVGRSRRARARGAGWTLGLVVLVWLGIVPSGYLHGRAWLITYAVLAGAVGIVLASRVRGLENRVRIAGRNASGAEDAGAGDRLRLRLQALGSRPAAGLELPEQTDVTKLPDDALGLLPDGALAKAVYRVVQTFLPASPWRVSVADLGDDRLGVTIVRNGRMVSATVVHPSDLGVPATTTAPHGLLDVGAAAFVLAELAKRYAYLDEGLSGATKWASIAAQAAASDRTLAVDDDLARALNAHAIEVDPDNAAARLAFYHRAYRGADSADEALAFATGLTTLAAHVPALSITVQDKIVTRAAKAPDGWTALQLRVLYNLAIGWLNRFLLLPASDTPHRAASWRRAQAAARAVLERLPNAAGDVPDLVRDLRPAAALTLGTITAEGLAAQLDVPPYQVDAEVLTGLLSIRTTYDRACYRVATGELETALRDLEVAASDSALRTWAASDPSMRPLATSVGQNREFRRIVGGPVPEEFVDLPPWKVHAAKLTKRGITAAEDLAAAEPTWLAAELRITAALAVRWRELAAVALTRQRGAPLPTSVVFLLFAAGIENRQALRAGITSPEPLAAELAEAAATYDVDVPTAGEIRAWQVDGRTPAASDHR